MKLAIIGAGKIVQDFLTVAGQIDGLELTAIAGMPSDAAALDALQAKYGIGKTYTDSTAAINDPDVDTVYVAVPNSLHFAVSKQALQAGKNVICEKPFVPTRKEAEELKALADQHNLILVEAITNQYLENFAGIKSALSGIGTPRIAEFNYSQYSSRYDAFRAGTVLPAFDPAKGGGALMDLNIYNIHMVVGLFGKPTVVHYLPNMQRGVDTSGILTLTYPHMQAVCIAAKDAGAPVRSMLEGEDGTIVIDGPTNELQQYEVQQRGADNHVYRLNQASHRMVAEFTRFVQMIANHDTGAANEAFTHSTDVLDVLSAARTSIQ
ncbi:Gfo/Idh/MocA family protein [Lacticaseibacillus sharpeae]|uniref:Dehydrogenase n=1 Tax=Lacticaseibacillus sharpeae JCM 1186 = DSM 20505 TaxID=1291052 RepID=A0A0R1ZLB1_9LACO|nr:Gfo/Idh/MocA family oxidoreductase [Lacticaseibacillus sharpeae]KRM55138.1 dehydrogenase [Lacticaseibacillus sharpeae JCM 1186 = DSM 20505]